MGRPNRSKYQKGKGREWNIVTGSGGSNTVIWIMYTITLNVRDAQHSVLEVAVLGSMDETEKLVVVVVVVVVVIMMMMMMMIMAYSRYRHQTECVHTERPCSLLFSQAQNMTCCLHFWSQTTKLHLTPCLYNKYICGFRIKVSGFFISSGIPKVKG